MIKKTTMASALVLSACTALGANAATVGTFNMSETGNVNQAGLSGTLTGSGTATIDDTGLITLNQSVTTSISGGFILATLTATGSLQGSVNASTGAFSWSTPGTTTVTSCTGNAGAMALVCPTSAASPGATQVLAYDQSSWTFAITPGGTVNLTSNASDPTNEIFTTFTTTSWNAPAAVPLPAAAWLFGSGLIGLAGVGRRRRRA